jgi:cell wall assembly regulator SMI1
MPDSQLQTSLERIKRWMLKNGAPLLVENLAAGASEATLRKATADFGFPIPEELRRLWLLHDGQREELNGFVEGLDLFDTRRARGELSTVKMFLEFIREDPSSWAEAGVSADEAQSDRWIPFAGRDSDLLVVSAISGRVFSCGKDSPPLHLLANSLAEWAETYARHVEADDYSVEEGHGDYYLQLRDRDGEQRDRDTAARRAEERRLSTVAPTVNELKSALRDDEDGARYQVLVERAQRSSSEMFATAVALLFERKAAPAFIAEALRPVLGAVALKPDQWLDVAEGGALIDNNAIERVAVANAAGCSKARVAQLARSVDQAAARCKPRLTHLLEQVRGHVR